MTCLEILFVNFDLMEKSRLQVFLKLRHETNVEHIFLMESSARQFKITLVKFLSPQVLLHALLFSFYSVVAAY